MALTWLDSLYPYLNQQPRNPYLNLAALRIMNQGVEQPSPSDAANPQPDQGSAPVPAPSPAANAPATPQPQQDATGSSVSVSNDRPPVPGPLASMPARPPSNLPSGSLNPVILGSYYNMPTPLGGGGGAALSAALGQPGVAAAAGNAPPAAAPPATGTATRPAVPGPLADPRTFQWSTWSGRDKPILTAGDWSGLFGRGAPPAAAGATPAARTYPGDDWSIDRTGAVSPSFGVAPRPQRRPKTPLAPDVARARILSPSYYG